MGIRIHAAKKTSNVEYAERFVVPCWWSAASAFASSASRSDCSACSGCSDCYACFGSSGSSDCYGWFARALSLAAANPDTLSSASDSAICMIHTLLIRRGLTKATRRLWRGSLLSHLRCTRLSYSSGLSSPLAHPALTTATTTAAPEPLTSAALETYLCAEALLLILLKRSR